MMLRFKFLATIFCLMIAAMAEYIDAARLRIPINIEVAVRRRSDRSERSETRAALREQRREERQARRSQALVPLAPVQPTQALVPVQQPVQDVSGILKAQLDAAYREINTLSSRLEKSEITGQALQQVTNGLVKVTQKLDALEAKVAQPAPSPIDVAAIKKIYEQVDILNKLIDQNNQQMANQQKIIEQQQQQMNVQKINVDAIARQNALKVVLAQYVSADEQLSTAYDNYMKTLESAATYTEAEELAIKKQLEESFNNYEAVRTALNKALVENGINQPVQLNKYYDILTSGAIL
jgi:hypothetical protein